jgi:hypothetical protein
MGSIAGAGVAFALDGHNYVMVSFRGFNVYTVQERISGACAVSGTLSCVNCITHIFQKEIACHVGHTL